MNKDKAFHKLEISELILICFLNSVVYSSQ